MANKPGPSSETPGVSIILPAWASELPREWSWHGLDEVCAEIVDCPHSTPEVVDDGPYLMARTTDVLGGVFRAHEAKRVSEASYRERIRRAEPQVGDLLYSREGTYFGVAAEVPPNTRICLGQRMVLLRPNPEKAEAPFVRHWLNSPSIQSYIHGHRDGSVAERLNLPAIRRLPICLPSLAEQRAIAHILGTLDDKIELNRRMSETLETMARALFKSWFVDFDPVRAKADGRDPGLPQPLADLFPARLVDSELGEIPEGWEVQPLGDMAALNPEVWTKETRPAEVRYIDLSGTKWGRIEAVKIYVATKAPSRAQRVLRTGDTIVGTVRPGNGSYALITEDELTGSTGFAVLRPETAASTEYVYLAATARDNIDALAHFADGAAYPAVRPEVVTASPIVRPDAKVLACFSSAAGALLARRTTAETETRRLGALRDTLLPKLISGELRVPDVERIVSRAET